MTHRRRLPRVRSGRALPLALGLLLAAAATASPPPERQRVIIRLADGAARARLMADARGAPLTLDARHQRVVTGLRSIHAASLSAARAPLAAAEAAGALAEIDRLWIVNAVVAEVDPAWIARLEADPAIAEIVPDRRLVLGADPPAAADATAAAAAVPVEELVRIRVPEVWAQGITGQGAIVANVDTGVNGDDDTMGERWRGRFAGSDASWYAPITLTVFPVDDGALFGLGHGTATMGIMTGGEATFGVAYDATWIAGDTFEGDDRWVSNALKIFEWLTDPDGDPTTRSDVPDVVNNSYGLETLETDGSVRCDSIFNEAMDALEAAGAIVIWSAGNLGTVGITAPASRADSPVNAFAVGGVTSGDEPVPSSGHGPSTCGGAFTTKPEVVAPGQSITSRTRFNQTSSAFTGTSFATPMVSGILALMRSKNPTITPEAAKSILIETARDLGSQGDDNETGHGLVDAAAAVALVDRPSQPLARLVGYVTAPPPTQGKLAPAGIEDALVLRPGGSHRLVPVLVNHGPPIPASTAMLSSPTPGVSAGGIVPLPAAATGETFGPAAGQAFDVDVAASVPPGSDIVLLLTVQGAAIGPFRMVLKAGEPIPGFFATHTVGDVRLSVTNFGALGYYTGLHGSGFILQGAGFRFPPASPNWLFHAGLMVGTGPGRLSDEIPYGEDTQNSSDWIPLPGFPIRTEPIAGGQRITTAYDDRRALDPLGLEVRQESFAFDAAGESFVLIQYILTNRSAQTIAGLRAGLFADWDLPGPGVEPAETADWDPGLRLGIVEGTQAGQPALGVVWLDATPLAQVSYAVVRKSEIVESTVGNPTGDRSPVPAAAPEVFGGEFSDVEKWNALASGQSRTRVTDPQDLYQVIGAGPLTLAAGATDTVAVALVAAADRAALQAVAAAAREAYFSRVLGTTPPPPPPPPGSFALEQNFPNPFRTGQATTIPFSVPAPESGGTARAELLVYDLSGRRVRTLVEGDVIPGDQAASWDGRDAEGRLVPSGVYIVRLVAAGVDEAIRVLVVR